MSLIPKIRANYYDPLSGKSYIADTDGLHEEHIHIRNQVVDPETLEWTNQIQGTAVGGEEEVAVTNWPTNQAVSGPLTDAELRNSDVKVTLDGESVPVTGVFYPDTQPVSGTFWQSTQPVSATSLPLPTGAATLVKQDTLESLIDTLHELIQRLAPLGGSISMVGGQALRVSYGGGTFATSGPQTSAQYIAAYHIGGRNYPFAVALHNMAAQANINNVTAA